MNNFLDTENLKSDEFKSLKKPGEELLYEDRNTDAVKAVQSFLNKEGFTDSKGEALRVDGRYGANTANAVMKYQKANGLTADGIVGDETWSSMSRTKEKKEKDAAFEEELKDKEGGCFYNNLQKIRKAQSYDGAGAKV